MAHYGSLNYWTGTQYTCQTYTVLRDKSCIKPDHCQLHRLYQQIQQERMACELSVRLNPLKWSVYREPWWSAIRTFNLNQKHWRAQSYSQAWIASGLIDKSARTAEHREETTRAHVNGGHSEYAAWLSSVIFDRWTTVFSTCQLLMIFMTFFDVNWTKNTKI